MDRPVGDALIMAFYKLAEGAAHDLKVIISGEGADEIFAGYSFHNVIQLAECYHQLIPGFLHQRVAMPMLRALPVDFRSTGKARSAGIADAEIREPVSWSRAGSDDILKRIPGKVHRSPRR